jgi:hypothetical protein
LYWWFLFLVKVVPIHIIKAHRGSGGTAPLILNLGVRRRFAVSITGIQRRYPLNRWLGELHIVRVSYCVCLWCTWCYPNWGFSVLFPQL